MKWQDVYRQRLTTAAEAVSHIQSGDRVVVGHACGSPETLLAAMVANRQAYRDVEIVHMVSMGPSEYCLPENSRHFIHNSFFAGQTTRKAINEGRAVFTPAISASFPSFSRKRLCRWMSFCACYPRPMNTATALSEFPWIIQGQRPFAPNA